MNADKEKESKPRKGTKSSKKKKRAIESSCGFPFEPLVLFVASFFIRVYMRSSAANHFLNSDIPWLVRNASSSARV